MTTHCDYFDDESIKLIKNEELDVLVRLGFRILKGSILTTARYGVWSFHHADNDVNRGGPAGFWEVALGEEVTGATLQVLNEELDAGLVLGKSYSRTEPVSVTTNRHNLYWQARHLLIQKLADLHLRGTDLLHEADQLSEWSAYSRPLFTTPGPAAVVRLATQMGVRLISRKVAQLTRRDQWFLKYKFGNKTTTGNIPEATIYRFKDLHPPTDRFWADPCPTELGGRFFVFFEEYIYRYGKGTICVAELGPKGFIEPPQIVLERDYHLSYPFVFKWNDEWYMIPETASEHRVELYRATRFPEQWDFQQVLIEDLHAVDATLAKIDNRWWMFTAVKAQHATEATLLYLYHGDTPLGPWNPHQNNPVKIDVRSARPAGPLFQYNGEWYRPSQCGAPNYGSSITVNKIKALTPTSFREEALSRILPEWDDRVHGTHTIAATSGLTLIDARRTISRFPRTI